jgi:hypothetical protein
MSGGILRTRGLGFIGLLLGLALTACGPDKGPPAARAIPNDVHVPPFARLPYQRFSREAAVQIAYREWRAFGQPVVVPNTRLPFDNERAEGLWQRVGEYWWLGLPMGSSADQNYTGKHDQNGAVFPPDQDGNYAWSAAFIDYVMRMAGAGRRFVYSPNHSDYINAARERSQPNLAISAERPELYAPQRGDLICMWRGRQPMRFDDLPAGRFPGHCDIVVAERAGSLEVIGGNVENSVSMRQVPVTAEGRLANPDGTVVDPDHPWFVVIRIEYEVSAPAPVS